MNRRRVRPNIPTRPRRQLDQTSVHTTPEVVTKVEEEKQQVDVSPEEFLEASSSHSTELVKSCEPSEHSEQKPDIFHKYSTDWTLRNFVKLRCSQLYCQQQKLLKQRWVRRKTYKEKFLSADFDPTDFTKVTLRDFVYFNNKNEPPFETPKPSVLPQKTNEDKESQPAVETFAPAPRLRIAEDGTIRIDEKSLVIEHQTNYEGAIVEEFGASHFDSLHCTSYRKFTRTKRWKPTETAKFYKALEIFGTDFGMISRLFPGRTRQELKRKFNKEDRQNTSLIDKLLFKHCENPDLSCFVPEEKEVKTVVKAGRGRRKKPGDLDPLCPGSDEDDSLQIIVDGGSVQIASDTSSRKIRRLTGEDELITAEALSESLSASSDQEAVIESISRLFESSRQNPMASPLVFVSHSPSSSDSASHGSRQGEIAIHMLTESDDMDQSGARMLAISPDTEETPHFNEEQVRQFLGDKEGES